MSSSRVLCIRANVEGLRKIGVGHTCALMIPADSMAEFADQVEVDFTATAFGGNVARIAPRGKWAAAVASGLARFFETQHFASNYFVEIDGDRATAITYFIARHFMKGPEGKKYVLDEGGYYTHGLVKINGVWKVNRNKLTPLWDEGDPEALKLAQAGGLSREWAELFGL